MSEENAIITLKDEYGALSVASATNVAEACREIVKATAVKVGGGTHIGIEGWLAIAGQHGCTVSSRNVRRTETGFAAEGVVTSFDGRVLSVAEGFVGDDEKTWSRRDEYAKRGMAQTRAMSRAARNIFAHVLVAMKAGISTTPAEEMPYPHHPAAAEPVVEEPAEEEVATDKADAVGRWLEAGGHTHDELRRCSSRVSEMMLSGEIASADAVRLQKQITSLMKDSEGDE